MKLCNMLLTIITLFFLSQSLYSSGVDAEGLNELCQKLEGGFITNAQCRQVFSQDFRSANAEYGELATIAIDILSSNASMLQSSINEEVKKIWNELAANNVLGMCSLYYGEGEVKLGEAKVASVAKDYKKAADALEGYMTAPVQACLDEFNKGGVPIPVVRYGSGPLMDVAFVAKSTQMVVGNLF